MDSDDRSLRDKTLLETPSFLPEGHTEEFAALLSKTEENLQAITAHFSKNSKNKAFPEEEKEANLQEFFFQEVTQKSKKVESWTDRLHSLEKKTRTKALLYTGLIHRTFTITEGILKRAEMGEPLQQHTEEIANLLSKRFLHVGDEATPLHAEVLKETRRAEGRVADLFVKIRAIEKDEDAVPILQEAQGLNDSFENTFRLLEGLNKDLDKEERVANAVKETFSNIFSRCERRRRMNRTAPVTAPWGLLKTILEADVASVDDELLERLSETTTHAEEIEKTFGELYEEMEKDGERAQKIAGNLERFFTIPGAATTSPITSYFEGLSDEGKAEFLRNTGIEEDDVKKLDEVLEYGTHFDEDRADFERRIASHEGKDSLETVGAHNRLHELEEMITIMKSDKETLEPMLQIAENAERYFMALATLPSALEGREGPGESALEKNAIVQNLEDKANAYIHAFGEKVADPSIPFTGNADRPEREENQARILEARAAFAEALARSFEKGVNDPFADTALVRRAVRFAMQNAINRPWETDEPHLSFDFQSDASRQALEKAVKRQSVGADAVGKTIERLEALEIDAIRDVTLATRGRDLEPLKPRMVDKITDAVVFPGMSSRSTKRIRSARETPREGDVKKINQAREKLHAMSQETEDAKAGDRGRKYMRRVISALERAKRRASREEELPSGVGREPDDSLLPPRTPSPRLPSREPSGFSRPPFPTPPPPPRPPMEPPSEPPSYGYQDMSLRELIAEVERLFPEDSVGSAPQSTENGTVPSPEISIEPTKDELRDTFEKNKNNLSKTLGEILTGDPRSQRSSSARVQEDTARFLDAWNNLPEEDKKDDYLAYTTIDTLFSAIEESGIIGLQNGSLRKLVILVAAPATQSLVEMSPDSKTPGGIFVHICIALENFVDKVIRDLETLTSSDVQGKEEAIRNLEYLKDIKKEELPKKIARSIIFN